jgi:hypothetical protein
MTLAFHRRGSAIRTSLFMPVLFPSHGDVAKGHCIDWLNIARSRVIVTNHVPLKPFLTFSFGRGLYKYSLRTGHSLQVPVECKKLHLFPSNFQLWLLVRCRAPTAQSSLTPVAGFSQLCGSHCKAPHQLLGGLRCM